MDAKSRPLKPKTTAAAPSWCTVARLFRDQGLRRTHHGARPGNAVGLQSGSLFYHFRNKEEILVAVMALGITSTMEQLAAALEVAKPLTTKSALIHVHLNSPAGRNQAALEVMPTSGAVCRLNKTRIVLRDRYARPCGKGAGRSRRRWRGFNRHPVAAPHGAGQPALVGGAGSAVMVATRWTLAERMLKLVIGPRPAGGLSGYQERRGASTSPAPRAVYAVRSSAG